MKRIKQVLSLAAAFRHLYDARSNQRVFFKQNTGLFLDPRSERCSDTDAGANP